MIPGHVDPVVMVAGPAPGIDGDHRLVVELARSRLRVEIRRAPRCTPVAGSRDGHRGPVDAAPGAEEDHDVGVEGVPGRVKGEPRVTPEVEAVVGARWRQRQVDPGKRRASVERVHRAHREPLDLIRAGDDIPRICRIDRDRRLALGSTFVARIDVRPEVVLGHGPGVAGAQRDDLARDGQVLAVPGRLCVGRRVRARADDRRRRTEEGECCRARRKEAAADDRQDRTDACVRDQGFRSRSEQGHGRLLHRARSVSPCGVRRGSGRTDLESVP